MQIRDGLHILGEGPTGRQRAETLVALARVPRGGGEAGDASLLRALAEDLGLGFRSAGLRVFRDPGMGRRPEALAKALSLPLAGEGQGGGKETATTLPGGR